MVQKPERVRLVLFWSSP